MTIPRTAQLLPSATIRERVQQARDIQSRRFESITGIYCNAHMRHGQIEKFCALVDDCLKLLEKAMTAQRLSARAYDRILKVSRTIADLAGEETIGPAAISEAINYRTLDREMWKQA